MNKVVNIEIAGQVFWIDESAYQILQDYLSKIKIQLQNEENAAEICTDIELRIAELLYELNSDKNKAITAIQVSNVISQVGFIEGEEESQLEENTTRKSYLDPENKILGGVCAGLATRLRVSSLLIRLVFIGLTLLMGLGAALYLIFWISLDSNASRNTTLAAHGKARTAKQIATFEQPKEKTLVQFQRIIFLPIGLVGTLLTIVGEHFIKRSHGYLVLIKSVFSLILVVTLVLLTAGVFELNSNQLIYQPISWLLTAAVIYLFIILLTVYLRKYYLDKSATKIKPNLKVSIYLPLLSIVSVIAFLIVVHSDQHQEFVERSFTFNNDKINILIENKDNNKGYYSNVRYKFKTKDTVSNNVTLSIDYASAGRNTEDAKNNIHSIDYYFAFDENTLTLSQHWSLKEGTYNRGQSVTVTVEVPQNVIITSPFPLGIYNDDRPYQYYLKDRYSETTTYLVQSEYFHEIDDDFSIKLSKNEKVVLLNKFCDEFFISDSWSCYSNIRYKLEENSRFDRAFADDVEVIEQLREFLQPNRSLFSSNLLEMNNLVKEISIEYPTMSNFQSYIEHLLKVKSLSDNDNKSMVSTLKVEQSTSIDN